MSKRLKLHNQDPIRFSLANQSLNIQQLHMLGEGTDLTAHGSIQLSGTRALDLTAEADSTSNCSPASIPTSLPPASSHEYDCRRHLCRAVASGTLQVANGALSYAGLPSGLSELNGSLLFTRDHIHIETLTARTGGGTLDLKGDANYYGHSSTSISPLPAKMFACVILPA